MMTHSLLWEIKNNSTKSYVFGTMHVKDDAAYKHIGRALNYVIRCKRFYTEINLDKAKTEVDISNYLLPNNGTLKDHFTEKNYLKAASILLKSFGVDLSQLIQFKPIITVNKISESILSDDNTFPLDQFLWQKAKELNIELYGLETIEEQLNTLESLDLNIQIKMFKDLYKNVSRFKKQTYKLKEHYTSQNINQLFKLSKKGLGKLRKPLLYDRNEIMANRIGKIGQPSFFAIGAAHLAGKKGVLNLLKQQGLKVSAIK